ncbi:MAG: DUF1272 domain-containing protein [Cognaticolwellia sp.]
MLILHPNCQCCDKDLPADAKDAMICSFECTFCRNCAVDVYCNVCPNCQGDFSPRPTRKLALLTKYPASIKRMKASVDD